MTGKYVNNEDILGQENKEIQANIRTGNKNIPKIFLNSGGYTKDTPVSLDRKIKICQGNSTVGKECRKPLRVYGDRRRNK